MARRSSLPDEELVSQAQGAPPGDLEAFEALVLRHQASVLANCHHLVGSPEDAEDLTQEVFIKIFFAMSSFEGRASFKTWLRRVKVNHCLNHLRSRRGKTFVDVESHDAANDPALQVGPAVGLAAAARSERQRIGIILDSMPDTLRIPLVLCDVDDLSYQEIADELGIGLSAVKMRIRRAREMFRQAYDSLPTLSPEAGSPATGEP